LEPSVQSSLNLIYQLGGPGPGGLAGTNEKYHIIGGNDQIAARMASELPPGFIQTEMSLVALALRSDGAYTCTFQRVASTLDVIADHVVLALPFEQLRKVDLSRAGFSALKMAAIAGYDLGTNAKLALQFNNRVWSTDDQLSGACNSDPRTFQLCWDGTVGQPGSMGILEDFLGGNAGGQNGFPGAAAHGPAPAVAAQSFLSNVEGPFPGATTAYTGSAWLDWWDRDPYISGSYGCYQLGNYTSFSGIEGRRERNVHFCGEQTSLRFQGFMEGALRSAEALAFQWPSR
jgi:monoamine oxidase